MPTVQTIRINQTVQFKCSSPHPVHWTFDDNFLPANAKVYKHPTESVSTLEIVEAIPENEGLYTCATAALNYTVMFGTGQLKFGRKKL